MNQSAARVAVCVCTYRRPEGLERVLHGLSGQRFDTVAPPVVSVIVTDNEGSTRVRELCSSIPRGCLDSVRYVHEPRRGISHARNTCLDNVPGRSDFIAMIDDDEVPAPDWLDALLDAQQRTGADVVIGPSLPVFAPGTPTWVAASGFFDKPRGQDRLVDLQADPPAATCNALIRGGALTGSGVRFHPRLALSGGEDALFFRELRRLGYSFAWSARARVHETVPPPKATLAYMLREEYRRGNVRVYLDRRVPKHAPQRARASGRLREARRAAKRIAAGLGGVLGSLPHWRRLRHRRAMDMARIARGVGMLAGLIGVRNEHYR